MHDTAIGALEDAPGAFPQRDQWYLDESLKIAVWELIFGTGTPALVHDLVGLGARWSAELSATDPC